MEGETESTRKREMKRRGETEKEKERDRAHHAERAVPQNLWPLWKRAPALTIGPIWSFREGPS